MNGETQSRYERRLDAYDTALRQAVAEIEGSPYQQEPWGWGMAFRMPKWKALIANGGFESPGSSAGPDGGGPRTTSDPDQPSGASAEGDDAEAGAALLPWHTISGETFLAALRRCSAGEDADLVYTELYANAEREDGWFPA